MRVFAALLLPPMALMGSLCPPLLPWDGGCPGVPAVVSLGGALAVARCAIWPVWMLNATELRGWLGAGAVATFYCGAIWLMAGGLTILAAGAHCGRALFDVSVAMWALSVPVMAFEFRIVGTEAIEDGSGA